MGFFLDLLPRLGVSESVEKMNKLKLTKIIKVNFDMHIKVTFLKTFYNIISKSLSKKKKKIVHYQYFYTYQTLAPGMDMAFHLKKNRCHATLCKIFKAIY